MKKIYCMKHALIPTTYLQIEKILDFFCSDYGENPANITPRAQHAHKRTLE